MLKSTDWFEYIQLKVFVVLSMFFLAIIGLKYKLVWYKLAKRYGQV